MKRVWRARLETLRNRLALTPKEKRVIAFVFAAFFLGLCAKCYRETHPQMPPQMDKKHPWRKYQVPSPSQARSPAKITRESQPSISRVEVATREERSSPSPRQAHRLRNGLSLSLRLPGKRNLQSRKLPLGLA
jgi:hypothetical protein